MYVGELAPCQWLDRVRNAHNRSEAAMYPFYQG